MAALELGDIAMGSEAKAAETGVKGVGFGVVAEETTVVVAKEDVMAAVQSS